ncbi:MAG: zinc-ribbon domain-containing protein [Promethearchaeia archaeon]
MKYCEECGAKLGKNWNYCHNCGVPIRDFDKNEDKAADSLKGSKKRSTEDILDTLDVFY